MYRSSPFVILAVFLLSLAVPAFAAPKRYSTTVNGRLGQFIKPQTSAAKSKKSLALTIPATVNVKVPGYGKVKLSFSSAQPKNWGSSFEGANGIVDDNKDVTLFKGFALFENLQEEVPAAGSVYKVNGVPKATIHFTAPEYNPQTDSVTRDLFEVKFDVTQNGQVAAKAELWAATKNDFPETSCASTGGNEETPLSLKKLASHTVATSYKVLELATEGDKEWFDQYGVNSNAQMATIVNAANTIYQRDLNVDISIVNQSTQTSISQPYTSTNANTLLDQFTTNMNTGAPLGAADLFHLFTGKDMDGSTVGIAWIGVVCSNWYFNTGVTQKLHPTLDHVIFAHEVGHNFGAGHDSNLPASVMYPSVGSTQTTFSATSIAAINSHLDSSPVCLATATATPTATPTATATATPSPSPTASPTPTPTSTVEPTGTPTAAPTASPTQAPTAVPTSVPTAEPTAAPTTAPTAPPTASPTPDPRTGPDPSNPKDGLPSPETTKLNVQAKYNTGAGRTELVVTLGGELNSKCRLNLQIADNLAFAKPKSISLRQTRNTRVTIYSRTSVRNRNDKVYFRATYNGCGGQAVLSETAETNPFSSRMRIKETPAKWISRL